MAVDVDRILELLSQSFINREVLVKHDVARESFQLPKMVVGDHQEFKYLVTSYVEHHLKSVGQGQPTPEAAFGEAKRVLDREFEDDRYQDGYSRALGQGLSGADGGMRGILNTIADAFRRRALSEYVDHVFYQHINVLSKEDNLALSRAFFERFGPVLARFGMEVSEDMFAWNTRAALDYHRQVLEHVIGIAKKI